MEFIRKIKTEKWVTRFSAQTERKFFFAMTVIMLILGILYKTGIIQG